MKEVKIGIIGAGSVAQKMHIPILSSIEGARIIALAESDIQRGEKIAHKWNIPILFQDCKEMCENSDIDAVFICLPNFLHYRAVKIALDNDLHVFCEKPMGLNAEEGHKLVMLAQKRNLVLTVGYHKRCEKPYEESSRIVKSLVLGKIIQICGTLVSPGPYSSWSPSSDWFLNDNFGALYDSGSHLIDSLLYISGCNISEISACGLKTMRGINIYDNISGIFRTSKNSIGSFNIGWRSSASHEEICIHGTGGSLFASPSEIEIRYGNHSPIDTVLNHLTNSKKILKSNIENMGNKSAPKPYLREDIAFINALRQNDPPTVSAIEGLRVLEILEAIKKSISENKIIPIERH